MAKGREVIMRKVSVRCDCCGETFEVEVNSNCNKSCAAIMRERRRSRRSKKQIRSKNLHQTPVVDAKAFLKITNRSYDEFT